MGNALSGAIAKFFSTSSIVSRVIRMLAVVGAYISQVGVPHDVNGWLALLAAAFAAMVPAGENQSAPATAATKKAIPPTA